MTITFVAFLTLIFGTVYAPFFEWTLHRFAMHEILFGLKYPFEAHALIHHQKFQADGSFHLATTKDENEIAMAWWNFLVIIPIGMIPFFLAAAIVWLSIDFGEACAVVASGLFVSLGYYLTYEYVHWCMHKPNDRFIERLSVFQILKEHHRLHHEDWKTNLNVILPLADWLLGTLRR